MTEMPAIPVPDLPPVLHQPKTKLMRPENDWSDIVLRTQDGKHLGAWYIPAQNGATVLLLHGAGTRGEDVIEDAIRLRNLGYGVLLNGSDDVEGSRAAINWLSSRLEVNRGQVGIYGVAMKRSAIVKEAAKDERIQGMILTTAPTDSKTDQERNRQAMASFFASTLRPTSALTR